MSLIVQKFGGSSVADAEKLLHSSHIIQAARDAGHDVIAVVSAQGDATDRLLQKAKELTSAPPPRELDALLAAGEQASAALTAAALHTLGVPAVSLGAFQLPIRSDGVHGDARIEDVGAARVRVELARGNVVVVTGFQGVDRKNDLTTLGRGGSDYTAVALAAAFGAEACLIYTDVDGVYTADPRLCPTAKRLARVSYADMYALSRAGAQVLHDKCVALAQEKGVEPEVRSAATDGAGTPFPAADAAFSRARSATNRSTRPMATALSTSLRSLPIVQNFWHCFSWGQTRPHTAGRSEVSRITASAPSKSPSAALARNPGMLIATGQPRMHGFAAHCMQRDASRRAISAV